MVVGLNPHQMQHVVTTINQHECFNESGILTHMSSMQDHSESFVENCFAVSGSHVVLLCLSESNYHLLDQSTIEKLSVAFREKSIWRLSRMANLRTESRNINKWKKELKGVSSHSHKEVLGTINQPMKKLTNFQDDPWTFDSGVDPLVVLSTCKNSKEYRHQQSTLKEIFRPRTAKNSVHLDSPPNRKAVVYTPGKVICRSQSLPNFRDSDLIEPSIDLSLPNISVSTLSPPVSPHPSSPHLRVRASLVGSGLIPNILK